MKPVGANISLMVLLALLLIPGHGYGQLHFPGDSLSPLMRVSMNRTSQIHDSVYLTTTLCKTTFKIVMNAVPHVAGTVPFNEKGKVPFITVHGNIQYDYLYRSFADTPFYQKDFQQHTVQTSLFITVKDKYPLHVNLFLRKSNSPYFKDFFDGGVVFDKYNYQRNFQQQVLTKISKQLPGRSYLDAARHLLKQEMEKYKQLKGQTNNTDLSQKIIEEREQMYYRSMSSATGNEPVKRSFGLDAVSDSIAGRIKQKVKDASADTLIETYAQNIRKKRKELDSLHEHITKLQGQIDSLSDKITGDLSQARRSISKAWNSKEVSKVLTQYGVQENRDRGERMIADLKTIGIGRSVLNYSELTAQNVSVTGFNFEYNPSVYMAFAVGKIDYGFRDFFGKNLWQKNQRLVMGRFGFGNKDRKAIIFSVFGGKRNSYQNIVSDTLPSYVNIAGYSVEGIFRKDENSFLNVELAKTTKPLTGSFRDNGGLKNLADFSDNTNLGVNVKGETLLSQTNTRLSGFYRKTGESFQSFSLFTYNTDQTAWLLRADQSLAKSRIGLTVMLKRNDFVNPFVQQTFKTSTVFKSFQANIRIPKWPVLSAGYYPGLQLYMIDKERARQNAYYILNGSLVHGYAAGGLRMLSSLMYNKYSSKGTDSGFVNYKGTGYMASQTFIVDKLQLQGQYTYTDQEQMRFFTLEANADYSFSSILQISAGGKYNKIVTGEIYWGGQASLRSELKRYGTIQLQYEKSFLPTIEQTLFPVEMGRISWFKNF